MSFFKEKKPEQAKANQKPRSLETMEATVRPGGVFMIQLLMKEPCKMPSDDQIMDVLSRHIGHVEKAPPTDGTLNQAKQSALFTATEHIAHFKNGQGSVQVAILPCDTFHPETIDEVRRSQMWNCRKDRDRILTECGYCILAHDLLGGAMEPYERADFLMDYLEALVELFPTCEAVYSLNSGKLILADTIRSHTAEGLERYIHHIVNVRIFNIEGTQDKVVDTLGLSLLYIEDLQYHYHDMDPNWVVAHAYNMARYILTNRCPIKDGDTIDGIEDGRFEQSIQWKCHFEDALVQPDRAVLDVCMGEYASGQR